MTVLRRDSSVADADRVQHGEPRSTGYLHIGGALRRARFGSGHRQQASRLDLWLAKAKRRERPTEVQFPPLLGMTLGGEALAARATASWVSVRLTSLASVS